AAYLEMHPIVPVGYPLFLQVVGAERAVALQPAVFAAAAVVLGLAILRATGSLSLALAVMIVAVANPELTPYHHSILSESLFASGLLVFLAAAIRFARRPAWSGAAAAALVAGATSTVRRAAWAWEPVLLLVVLMVWRALGARRWVVVAAALVPFVTVVAADRALSLAIHGERLT